MNFTEQDKHYIAGFLDCKSFLNIAVGTRKKPGKKTANRYKVMIHITSRNLSVLNYIEKYYGGKIHMTKDDTWILKMGAELARLFLIDFKEYFVFNYEKTVLALSLLDIHENCQFSNENKDEEKAIIKSQFDTVSVTGASHMNHIKTNQYKINYISGIVDDKILTVTTILPNPIIHMRINHENKSILNFLSEELDLEFVNNQYLRINRKNIGNLYHKISNYIKFRHDYFDKSIQFSHLLDCEVLDKEKLIEIKNSLSKNVDCKIFQCYTCSNLYPSFSMKNKFRYCEGCSSEYSRKYYEEHKEECITRSLKYQKDNWETIKKNRRNQTPQQKARAACRHRMHGLLKNFDIKESKIALIGCSPKELALHLEKQFTVEMMWENYAKVWHIDHIIPCAAFDLRHESERKKCFNFSNLRPLLGGENENKSDFLEDGSRGRDLRKLKELGVIELDKTEMPKFPKINKIPISSEPDIREELNSESKNFIINYLSEKPCSILIDRDSLKSKYRYRVRMIFRAASEILYPLAARYCTKPKTKNGIVPSLEDIKYKFEGRCAVGVLILTDQECARLLTDFAYLFNDNPRVNLAVELLNLKSFEGGPGRGNKNHDQAVVYEKYLEIRDELKYN